MEEANPVNAAIDQEITSIRSQISALRHRRSLLFSTLLTSATTTTRLSAAAPSDASTQALEAAHSARTAAATHLYRATAGITAFRVQDPDPHAADSGRVLGVRIDVFSRRERRFTQPFYLLLHRVDADEADAKADPRWRLHKHTVPPFIPLQTLVWKHLPAAGAGRQNLHRLCRAVRAELVRWQRRVDAVAELKTKTEEMQEKGIFGVRERNLRCEELDVSFNNGAVARVVLGPDGTVEKAMVVGAAEEEGVEMVSAHLNRMRSEIQRAIKGGDRSVEGILERIPIGAKGL